MSILLNGMEMPKDCCECPLTYYGTCIFTGIEALSIGIQKDCPLVPVQPHGRLIDADALKDLYHYNTHDSDIDKAWTGNIRRSIDSAHTVIEAEEDE